MRRSFLVAMAFVASVLASVSTTMASECTVAELLADPHAVIDPCTQLLSSANLDRLQRAEALFIRGQAFHRTKRLAQAGEDYAAAVVITPKNEDIWVAWSNLDLRRGDMQGYVEKVERAAALNEHSARVLRSIGLMLWVYGEVDKALEFCAQALKIDPTEPFARLYRSEIYQARHKFPEAIADAGALIALSRAVINRDGYFDKDGNSRDFHIAALIHRADLYVAAGQDDLAVKDYDAAVSDGRTAPALLALGHFLSRKHQAEALALIEEAVAKEPANASAQFALGRQLVLARRFRPALAAFNAAIGARPDFADAYQMRARMHREFGETEQAIKDYTTAIQLEPGILEQSMYSFRAAGYWTGRETPKQLTPELQDAIRACMLDTTCN